MFRHLCEVVSASVADPEPPRFRVLGPLEVRVRDRPLDLGGPRLRALLALLIAGAGRVTGVAAAAEALWDVDAPPDAHRTVRTYVSRLRRSLSPAATALGVEELIATHPAGYVLHLPPDVLDAQRFERLVAAGRDALASGEPAVAVEQLTAALSLWHGDAYAEFTEIPALRSAAARLHDLRLAATEDRIDAELATGSGRTLVDELTALTTQHPGHDRLWAQLMTALYRAGRQADALDAFLRARTVLVQQFGLDPSPALIEVHRQVLGNDPRLLGDRAGRRTVRNDLPADVADFAGRRDELTQLLDTRPATVVIGALDGMAGVGKTALAVHAAHLLTDRYPDAQLFIDLHGHTSGQAPVAPMTALDRLLRALGVPAELIPNDLDARAALWRAELANRSVLAVLDNAVDAAQLRPLLPGTGQSLMLITSRRRLVDLETASILSLDVLPQADAVALFTDVVGDDRAVVEVDSVRLVVELCGRLPLAIRIAAARLRTRPAWTVRHLADRLRQARWPLAELSAGDRSVAAAFALSYQQLDSARQRMFRLLGLHPGPDIDTAAAASLAAVAQPEAEQLLESLVDDHLLDQPVAGRYRFHDLIRQHAHTTALAEESGTDQRSAVCRVLDHYLHTAYRGSRLLDQQHPPIDIGTPARGTVPTQLADDAAAMAWFDTNHTCVLAACAAAGQLGWDTAVWQLAWTLDNFHYRRGYIHDNITSWLAGLAAAERLSDVAVQAKAHRRLGLVYAPLGRTKEALRHLGRSLTLSEQVGDRLGQAGTHFILAMAWTAQRDDHQALAHATAAQRLFRDVGDTIWEVRALNLLGACHTRLGHHAQARTYCQSALALCRQRNDVYGQADSLDALGAIANDTDQSAEALRHYQQALGLWYDLDNTYRQAGTLAALGDTYRDLDRNEQAQHSWTQAIALYRSQNLHAVADEIEQRAAESADAPGPDGYH
jgi:DNA-binding SARP family transcriptional activator